MTDNFIQLEKNNVLKLQIKTKDGKLTGEYLEFDLDDIELPLKYQELVEKNKKNIEYLRNQFIIIEKRQDVKGKKLMTKNEEDKVKAINEFYKKEIEVYNMFLGERGVEKLLNGRKIGWSGLDEIDEIIEKQIMPYIKVDFNNIAKKVKEKYGKAIQKSKELKVKEESQE